MPPQTLHATLPPFPSDLPTAPLVSVSLAALEAGDPAAEDALWAACQDLGFFYLDMFGSAAGERIVAQAEAINKVQNQFWALGNDELDKYSRDRVHEFFAYRYGEPGGVDANGVKQRNANYNVGIAASKSLLSSSLSLLADPRSARTMCSATRLACRHRRSCATMTPSSQATSGIAALSSTCS